MLQPLSDDDPRQVGPYRLQGRIGAGGMGTVYLGFGHPGFGAGRQPVAVKVPAAGLADDPEFRGRFRTEVAAARRVRGRSVAEVLDADVDGPRPWMATEYVEGRSLTEAVALRGPFTGRLLDGLAVGLADALVAIHAAGVVHRDLKPSNILVTWEGPKVIDFGIARAEDSTSHTRTGTLVGTLVWMAPEQLRGERAGPPTDVFAWGACVVFAATGRLPFSGERAEAIAMQIMTAEPDLAGVPPALARVLGAALDKDPVRRPAATQLVAWLVGQDVSDAGTTEAGVTVAAARTALAQWWSLPPTPPQPTSGQQVPVHPAPVHPAPGPQPPLRPAPGPQPAGRRPAYEHLRADPQPMLQPSMPWRSGISATEIMKTPICDQILALCTSTLAQLPAGRGAAVTAVRDRLSERTLRIAVGGRLNAGKSTLVNALLGQRLAATNATECTMLVTWFRHHHQNRVVVTPYDGEPFAVPPARGGGVPADLRIPRDRIRCVTVEVSNTVLAQRHIVVDTPGLDALSGLDQGSLAALADADALLYVTPHPGEGDTEALEALRGTATGANLTATNVLGVLSRVDQLGDGQGDPWEQARRVAASYASTLRGLVGDVVPVVGLLAQTALGDVFTESDTRLLLALAAADRESAMDALYSPDDFLDWDTGPLAGPDRRRLMDLLGTFGTRESLRLIDGGARGTTRLLDALRVLSGIDDLRACIDRHFMAAADRIRAARALAELDAASWLGQDADTARISGGLRSEIDRLRRDPALRQVELGGALTALASGKLRVDEEHAAALVALATGSTDASRLGVPDSASAGEVRAAADAWTTRWRTLESSPSRLLVRYARTARELCESMYFRMAGTG